MVMTPGALYGVGERCVFTAWAPLRQKVELKLFAGGESGEESILPMKREISGHWSVEVEGVSPGSLYLYRLDGETDRPDPASHSQPLGVHGPSAVVDHRDFAWEDGGWEGVSPEKMIIYELHTGVFTPEGTFEGVIGRLDDLRELGVNTLELMPVAQFPGARNWGYDGVFPFSVQDSYGGPAGLKRLVNECHLRGMAVVLDVVYNHLGPEGNYLGEFGPYFTDRYRTLWGDAINFDGPWSNGVREFFAGNALHWFGNYHVDALRLDAIHAIFDMSARPFLLELSEKVKGFSKDQGRRFYLMAEDDLNDSRIVRDPGLGGLGLDAQWCDDFHHTLHCLLTGEDSGYYSDFGATAQLVKAFREGHVFSGEYSRFRLRNHGNSSVDIPASRFVVFSQNHDQTGNRALGERLSALVDFESLKLAACTVILSPFVPLLFMGEEYGEGNPFLYFVSHADHRLIESVRTGRRREFSSFNFEGEPPDPQSTETFSSSVPDWEKRNEDRGKTLLGLYKELIAMRKGLPALADLNKKSLDAWDDSDKKVVYLHRWKGGSSVFYVFNFNRTEVEVEGGIPPGRWKKALDSSDKIWAGPGTAVPERIARGESFTVKGRSLVLFSKE